MEIWKLNIFWILIFVLQVIILSIIANRFHLILFDLTGFSKNRSAFSAKVAGLFLFLGTLVHELSHVLMAAILFVRVKSLNIKTELVEDKHLRLGNAEVELVDPFRNALIGIAPLVFGIVLIYFLGSSVDVKNISWITVLQLILISQISNSMFLSESDTVYFKYLLFIIFGLGILFGIINFFLLNYDLQIYFNYINNFLFGDSLLMLLQNISLVFLFIIILNFLINLLLRFFIRK